MYSQETTIRMCCYAQVWLYMYSQETTIRMCCYAQVWLYIHLLMYIRDKVINC